MWLGTIRRIGKSLLQVFSLAVLLLSFSESIKSQAITKKAEGITIDVKNESLQNILLIIGSQTSFRFAYDADLVGKQPKITIRAIDEPLADVLNSLFKETGLTFQISDNQIILQNKLPSKITLSGFTRDKKNREVLTGTNIFLPALKLGVVANSYGFYSITVSAADSLEVEISYAGFETIRTVLAGRKDLRLDIQLDHREDSFTLRPVIVMSERNNPVNRNQVDLIDLSTDMITATPAVSGNGDIINSIQLSAGVQAGMDGTAGYFVRGGNADQNQVLLDEATLYNPGHLFGLVSVFNSPAIRKATLLKGGFPAPYGDNLSSVLEVHMKDGSDQQLGGELQLGTMASSMALYGPVTPGRSSFFLSVRRSTIDWMLRPVSTTGYFSNYYFYDLNAKLQFRLSARDRIYFSMYQGSDKGAYNSAGEETEDDSERGEYINYNIAFGNRALGVRWNHVYSKKLFSNTSLFYTSYFQRVSTIEKSYFAELYSGIRDLHARTDFYYYPHVAHRMRMGIDYLQQSLFPATLSNKVSSAGFLSINENDIPKKSSDRFAAYLSDDYKVTRTFNIYAGIRVPLYRKPQLQYLYVEPRLSLLYLTGENSSIKLAYSRMHQYIYQVQSYNATFPAEIWMGSSSKVKPQASHQLSAGWYKNFGAKMFQAGLEVYYKTMDNQLLLKGGTTTVINNDLEENLIFGKGWSYGSELIIRKNRGKAKGWICYSFSNAYQQFDSLNHGAGFPLATNRKHSLYLLGSYDFDQHWSAAATAFLASGRSVTLDTHTGVGAPSGSGDDNPLYDEDGHNSSNNAYNHQLSPYNRVDVSLMYRKTGALTSEWVLSVYNVLAHRNTQFYYRSIDPVTKKPYIKEIPFFPVIPTLTYRLKF
ncbi:hypothetical protein A4D02_27605 [Niastella koreensis]|uniref:TonB-dependent receptor n=2 Tax=Niastella koreensis TaxID=354356 RepID=G8TI06_NIAKG|nr:TonB-dependent receptor [Niastella koreensis]AEV99609.1 TonB-dependent receptor [Niastella koreensis GR20-10]OQP50198.1 hypothetical protein A4D02_27605 [Niastella koreensis]